MTNALKAMNAAADELCRCGGSSMVEARLRETIEQVEKAEPDGYVQRRMRDSFVIAGYETCEKDDFEAIPFFLNPAHAIPEGWQPIETAPWETEVLLLGPSGYLKPHDKFFINGYRVRDWHQGDWNDATGTHLSECGWKPTHWMPLPPAPEIKP